MAIAGKLESGDEEEEETASSTVPISRKAAIAAVQTLRCLAQQHIAGETLFDRVTDVEDAVYKLFTGMQ